MKCPIQVKCPCCNGEGGETEAVLDYGIGPYYECCFCKGEGKISPWMRLVWLWDCQIMEWICYERWKKLFCLFGVHSKPWHVCSCSAKIHTVTHTCIYCNKMIVAVDRNRP